ncbi:hypothetical protein EVAR_63469_1 [Eumeta japonica]|uniref:Uncharacterized protein n=1 Tax=Eumeta variegata TaxID=151549 RepID=A0A4C1YAB2_EUMVA|nr:hypothetical protein EVAR_63469_1 [Eumeta japonica]
MSCDNETDDATQWDFLLAAFKTQLMNKVHKTVASITKIATRDSSKLNKTDIRDIITWRQELYWLWWLSFICVWLKPNYDVDNDIELKKFLANLVAQNELGDGYSLEQIKEQCRLAFKKQRRGFPGTSYVAECTPQLRNLLIKIG